MSKYQIGEVMSDEDSIAHVGVKGMKWGHRKAETAAPKIGRKQNRQMNKEARNKFDAEKATKLYGEAKKHGDKVLIATVTPGSQVKSIVTGKEFVDYMNRGGAMNVRMTEIYARKSPKDGAYELNSAPIGNYQKQDFRNK